MKGHIERGRVKGTWYLRVELPRDAAGERHQHRETYRGTKREAETRVRELLRLAESDGIDVARLTFVELVLGKIQASNACDHECACDLHEKHRDGGWLKATKTRVGRRTWLRYRQIVKEYLVPAFGELRVDKLRPAHIEGAIAHWSSGALIKRTEKPLSPRSVRHLRDTMRAACRWGLRMELMSRDVTAAVEPPKVEQKEMQTLDATGVAALLTAAEGTELQAPIAVLVGTGLRRGEALGLRWGDLNLEDGRLTVRRSVEFVDGQRREKPPKTTRSARTLSLAAFVVAALRRQKKEQLEQLRLLLADDLAAHRRQEGAYVFDRADGSPWNPDSFSWAFAALIRRAKLPKVRLHDLRHSHATLSLAAGADLKTISTALGHSTIALTANTYIHAIEAMQRGHADRIEAILGEAVASAMAGPSQVGLKTSVPQQCHVQPLVMKKARKYRPELVAPAGFESARAGPRAVADGQKTA
jgi:integrase